MKVVDIEQGSYEWHCLRHGKVTGTRVGAALGSPKVQQTLLHELVAERMTEPQISENGSAAMERGKELEPLARKAVIDATGIPFTETGMLLSDALPDFGLSPDAVLIEGGEVVGGLEIKCPTSKKHVEYLIAGGIPKEYGPQVRAPFILSDSVQWWYFASFDDRNYESPLYLYRLARRDIEGIDKDRAALQEFLGRVEQAHTDLTF